MGKLSGWALNANKGYPYKKEAEGDRTVDGRKGNMTRRQRPEDRGHKPGSVSSHQQLEEPRDCLSPGASRGEHSPASTLRSAQ